MSLRWKENVTVKGDVFSIVSCKERIFLSKLIKITCYFGRHKFNLIHTFGVGWSYKCERCDKDKQIKYEKN